MCYLVHDLLTLQFGNRRSCWATYMSLTRHQNTTIWCQLVSSTWLLKTRFKWAGQEVGSEKYPPEGRWRGYHLEDHSGPAVKVRSKQLRPGVPVESRAMTWTRWGEEFSCVNLHVLVPWHTCQPLISHLCENEFPLLTHKLNFQPDQEHNHGSACWLSVT